MSGIFDSATHLFVYTDGSMRTICRVRRAGAGTVIYHKGREVKALRMGLGPAAEVYDGELTALLMGATVATRIAANNPSITNIHFYADNSAAIQAIFDPKPKPGQLTALNFHNKISKFLDENDQRRVRIGWIPGHCHIKGNDRADELAKDATTLPNNNPDTRTMTNAKRRAKARVQREWVHEWRKKPKTGAYAVANRIPPSTRPTEHFTELQQKRELYGRLNQCRIGHGYFGEYYKKFVHSEDIDCPCGEHVQTREHILQECPKYETHRHYLRDAAPDVALSEVLGTREGIKALTKFLSKTGAFSKSGRTRPPPEPPDIDDPENDITSDESEPDDDDNSETDEPEQEEEEEDEDEDEDGEREGRESESELPEDDE